MERKDEYKIIKRVTVAKIWSKISVVGSRKVALEGWKERPENKKVTEAETCQVVKRWISQVLATGKSLNVREMSNNSPMV